MVVKPDGTTGAPIPVPVPAESECLPGPPRASLGITVEQILKALNEGANNSNGFLRERFKGVTECQYFTGGYIVGSYPSPPTKIVNHGLDALNALLISLSQPEIACTYTDSLYPSEFRLQ